MDVLILGDPGADSGGEGKSKMATTSATMAKASLKKLHWSSFKHHRYNSAVFNFSNCLI